LARVAATWRFFVGTKITIPGNIYSGPKIVGITNTRFNCLLLKSRTLLPAPTAIFQVELGGVIPSLRLGFLEQKGTWTFGI
jgi:hypothetical protein